MDQLIKKSLRIFCSKSFVISNSAQRRHLEQNLHNCQHIFYCVVLNKEAYVQFRPEDKKGLFFWTKLSKNKLLRKPIAISSESTKAPIHAYHICKFKCWKVSKIHRKFKTKQSLVNFALSFLSKQKEKIENLIVTNVLKKRSCCMNAALKIIITKEVPLH